MINQATIEIQGGLRLQLEIRLLVMVRYTMLLLEASVLSLMVAQLLWLGRDLTFMGAGGIAGVAAVCPITIWAIMGEERRLRKEL